MIVSRFEPIITVTVTVKGEPAIAVAGAVKIRIACLVPQLTVASNRAATLNAHKGGATNRRLSGVSEAIPCEITGSASAFRTLLAPSDLNVAGLLWVVMAGFSQPDGHSKQRSIHVDAIIQELRFGQVPVRNMHVVHAS